MNVPVKDRLSQRDIATCRIVDEQTTLRVEERIRPARDLHYANAFLEGSPRMTDKSDVNRPGRQKPERRRLLGCEVRSD